MAMSVAIFKLALVAVGDRHEVRAEGGARHIARGALKQAKSELRLQLAQQFMPGGDE